MFFSRDYIMWLIEVERFLPSDDPIKEDVLEWIVERNSRDVHQLLFWLSESRSLREKRAMVRRIRELVGELEEAMEELALLT